MIKIKLHTDYRCHFQGFQLLINGKPSHIGYFVNVAELRKFWSSYRPMIVLGYVLQLDNSMRIANL